MLTVADFEAIRKLVKNEGLSQRGRAFTFEHSFHICHMIFQVPSDAPCNDRAAAKGQLAEGGKVYTTPPISNKKPRYVSARCS